MILSVAPKCLWVVRVVTESDPMVNTGEFPGGKNL